MRIMYNPNYLFNNVSVQDKKKYFKRISSLANDLENIEGNIPPHIINKYRMKKMRGTKSIFKFYLDNTSGARCIFKYEDNDTQIFNNEKGILLLRAVDHDEQGIIGRELDKEFFDLEMFLAFDETYGDSDNLFNDDKLLSIEQMENNIKEDFIATYSLDEFSSFIDVSDKMHEIDDRAIYRLSDNQLNALDLKGPVFLKGSAGSGKTLVEISKALKNAHFDSRQGYFTFTPLLKETASDLYKKYQKMDGIKGTVEFYVMKDYMLNELGLSDFNYFSFEMFNQWFNKEKFNVKYQWLNNIDVVLLWTEIRGLIKGFAGNNDYRILTSSKFNDLLKKEQINDLLNARIIERSEDSKSRYHIIDEIELYNRLAYSPLHDHLKANSTKLPLLDKYSYVDSLTERYSPFDKKTRGLILDFTKRYYQKHLEDNKLYDDNDLARMLIDKVNNNDVVKFDYILVDELQDLTEMQIIALSLLAKDKTNIMLAGDISQVINPTFFARGRTGLIYRNHFNLELNESVVLNENYRNSDNIVKVIQKLLEVRQDKLGTYSDDIKEVSVELDKKEGLPIFIDMKKDKMLDNLASWIDVPKVAVIVPSTKIKQELLNQYNEGEETNIYSVQEIKGQEFSKIITYNIVSNHKDIWDRIMKEKLDKGSDLISQYRYYFNLLYVAVTRGRENLFMYEENKNSLIMNEIINLFEIIDDTNLDVLDVSAYDTENIRKEQAQSYFNQRDYLRAKNMYLRLNNKTMSQISNAKHNLEIGNIEDALVELLAYEDHMRDALSYIDKEKHPLLYAVYSYEFNINTIYDLNDLLGDKSIIKLAFKYRNYNNYEILLEKSLRLLSRIKTYRINQLSKDGGSING